MKKPKKIVLILRLIYARSTLLALVENNVTKSQMASGWLQQKFSRAHYGRVALYFLTISLSLQTVIVLVDYYLDWDYRWAAILAQPLTVPRLI